MKKFERLSKKMSFLLRHHPEKYGIQLSSDGWGDVVLIAETLGVYKKDIEELVRTQIKKRFELKEGRIRALYGHTIKIEFVSNRREPPRYLYHGTSSNSAQSIFKNGLLPMKRRWVHLSETRAEALMVGLRKDPNPLILRVKAQEAFKLGIRFYKSGDVWLCGKLPPQFIEIAPKLTK